MYVFNIIYLNNINLNKKFIIQSVIGLVVQLINSLKIYTYTKKIKKFMELSLNIKNFK
jgi:hypothetical protein